MLRSQMNTDERSQIIGLFDRMRTFSGIEKDGAAAQLIDDEVRRNPDAPYLLAQSVLVQEQALQRAEARIRELETDLSTARASAPKAAAGSSQTFARNVQSSRSASVPAAGAQRSDPSARPTAGGGFMSQALATATGVAGGMLLASGISSLFSNDSASASETPSTPTDSSASSPSGSENAAADSQSQDASAVDAANEPGADDGGWGDWGDFGSDLDI